MTKRIIVTVLTACLVCGAVFAQNAKTLATQGQDHMKNGNYAEAVAAFEAAIKLDAKNKQYPNLLKEAQQKRMEEAFAQAQKLYQEGNFEEAINMYNAAIRYAPNGYNTRNIQTRRNEAQEALAHAKQQAELEEQKALAEQKKAHEEQQRQLAEQQRLLEEQEKLAKAQADRERTEQARQTILKGNELFIGGKYSDAIAQYEHAVNSGAITTAEIHETNRLIKEAQELQTKMASYNRALKDDDFDVIQNTTATITITKYKASESKTLNIGGVSHTVHFGILNVVIPAKLYNVNVTVIGNEAFKNCGIVTLIIPDTVTEIGYGAFYGNNLERITIGRGIKVIKGGIAQGRIEVSELGAFEGNKSLTEIFIPDTVTEIGARAFKDCGLKSVTIGKGVTIIGESAFRNNQLPVVTLPAAIKTIRRFAFHQNQIQSLTLPNGISEIYDDAFTKNPLTAVVIPVSLATLVKINGLDCPRIGGDHKHYSAFIPTFPDTLTRVTLPANMQDGNLETFEESLRNVYTSPTVNKRLAGTFVKNGPVWIKQ